MAIESNGPGQSARSLSQLQGLVARALGASRVTWIAGYRGPYGRREWLRQLMDGWKVLDSVAYPPSESRRPAPEETYYKAARKRGLDELTELALTSAGSDRVHRLHADIRAHSDGAEWPVRSADGESRVADRMLVVHPVSPEAESYLVLDRRPGAAPFTQGEADRALSLSLAFPRLHHWLFLERGLAPPASRPFSPRQRDIVKLMLEPLSEQEMANATGLTAGAVHSYVIEIYRNLDVNSRSEMLALWLGDLGG